MFGAWRAIHEHYGCSSSQQLVHLGLLIPAAMIHTACFVLIENRSSDEALLNGLRWQDHQQHAGHWMPLCCLVVLLLSKMKSVQVVEMCLVIRHLLPTRGQTSFHEELPSQFALMQLPSQQDQAVQQNVPDCGDRTAATEPRSDKNIVLRLRVILSCCSQKLTET
jgi:hypothetical protein